VTNQLFEIVLHLGRSPTVVIPQDMSAGFMAAYVGATDWQAAARQAVEAARAKGFVFQGIKGDAREIPVASWGLYVDRVWPEFKSNLPTENTVFEIVKSGTVFFGPFCGFQSA
jgi:hypothetical protein